ncbi:hypothetical protein FUAX_00850 [Fulvitalea axinellae]|uniref:Lipoprotein n=1 Tax=Fulvitalea axinellae TaxID=1182444 RepID=A0AAU9CI33_9BACT|nr:hypothetical protein FUAX_00850 [Fulvitalea axinellae]
MGTFHHNTLLLCAFLSLVILAGLSGCTEKEKKDPYIYDLPDSVHNMLPPAKGELLFMDYKTVDFVRKGSKDHFVIRVMGPNFLESTVVFEIFGTTGNSLYRDSFRAFQLLGQTELNLPNPSIQEREEAIINRLKHFFDKDRFRSPAIPSGQTFVEDVSVDGIWQETAKRKDSVSFYYLIELDLRIKIVFYPETGKVEVYERCC